MSAREIAECAADWIQRRGFWDWGEPDQAALDAWLAEQPAHLVAYLRAEAAWSRTERLTALGRENFDAGESASARPFRTLISIAAAFVAAIAIGVFALQYTGQPHDRIFSTQVGGHKTIAFADGTRIELNTDTVLRARMTTAQRTIWLEKGEAYFQVKHNAADPFIVYAGRHRVTDLGTKFLVRRDPGRLEVALLEGRVRFGAANGDAQSALLKPGDVATATTSTMFVAKENLRKLNSELSWRRGLLVFKHTTLAAAATEFNRYNRQQLIVADPAAAQITIDGTFPVNNVEDFSRLTQVVLGLDVQNRGDDIVIRSKQ
jgi:transmembrane sensor